MIRIVALFASLFLANNVAGFDWPLTKYQEEFLNLPSSISLRNHLKFYTSEQHMAGTRGDWNTAVYTLKKFQEFGLQAKIESLKALLSFPEDAALAIVEPKELAYTANLAEDIILEDFTSDNWLRNHTFNGYSPSGNVTGELVYANYGTKEDFEFLAKNLSINLVGKIAIVRYGMSFRGLKVRNAQSYGMAGVIIYSDPQDDGFVKGKTYPDGPWRPKSGVQRGGVPFASLCSGDPGLVERDPDICGYATEDLIPKIPVLPISYGNAKHLLSSLKGFQTLDSWTGGLDIPYMIGPGPSKVNLYIKNKLEVREIWNVIAMVPSSENISLENLNEIEDEMVIMGNHRDAWVYGAADPNSGTSVLMEIAESFGKLFRSGWRPGRSILLCSWDGEEYGLIGSTNFGERHAKVLTKNAVVYLNVDMAVAGKKLMVKATPSLANLISSTLSRIPDPELNQSLLESWDKYLGALGSGSDFSVFLDHLGIISADISFKGEYGVYHSVFDSFHWMEKFGDPEFKYHKAMSQLWGLLAMRIADSRVLAFDYRAYGDRLTYLVNGMKSDFAEFGIDFSPLLSASQNLSLAGISFLKKLDLLRSEGLDSFARKFNSRGYLAERLFLDEDGIPMRKWFKHIVQAPGLDSGYGAVPFPGIVDALEAGNLSQALTQLERVVSRINQVASFVSSNTELALK